MFINDAFEFRIQSFNELTDIMSALNTFKLSIVAVNDMNIEHCWSFDVYSLQIAIQKVCMLMVLCIFFSSIIIYRWCITSSYCEEFRGGIPFGEQTHKQKEFTPIERKANLRQMWYYLLRCLFACKLNIEHRTLQSVQLFCRLYFIFNCSNLLIWF